jgi:hypothetical protein
MNQWNESKIEHEIKTRYLEATIGKLSFTRHAHSSCEFIDRTKEKRYDPVNRFTYINIKRCAMKKDETAKIITDQ